MVWWVSDRGSRADILPSAECWTPGRWRSGNSGRIQWTQPMPVMRHSCPGTLPKTAHHAKRCLHNALLQIISAWSCSHKWAASRSNLEYANVTAMTSWIFLITDPSQEISDVSRLWTDLKVKSNHLTVPTGRHWYTYHPEHTASSQFRRIYWCQWWCCSWWSGYSCTARAFRSPER